MAMSDEKITQVLDLYEAKATELYNAVPTMDEREKWGVASKIRSMIPTCREFLKEGRREKLMRWLGFMQGAWWVADVYTVDELKKHNMPDGEEFKSHGA